MRVISIEIILFTYKVFLTNLYKNNLKEIIAILKKLESKNSVKMVFFLIHI